MASDLGKQELEHAEDDVSKYRKRFESSEADYLLAGEFGDPPSAIEVVIGTLAITLWMVFLCAGIMVATSIYREKIAAASNLPFWDGITAWCMVLVSYTIPNVGWLAFFAAIVGEFLFRTRAPRLPTSSPVPRPASSTFRDIVAYYAAAGARGFVIYLLAISGLLVLTTNAITEPTQDQYVRIASTISVVALLVGYDSSALKVALDRVAMLISKTPRS